MYMFEVFQRRYYQILYIVSILPAISAIYLGENLATRTLVKMFFNSKQKHTNDLVRKEQKVDFKKGQRKKEKLFLS